MTEDSIDITNTLELLLLDFLKILPSLIAALVIFVVGLILTILTTRTVRLALQKRDVKPEAVTVLVRLTYISLLILTLVISLQQIGFNLTAFLTGLGILGFTVGFALQDVSKNLVAGVLLLIQQPFEIGDSIEVDNYRGEVLEINMRATRLLSSDGLIVLIPNADVFAKPIINFTQAKKRRVDIEVGVNGESDLEFVRATALGAVRTIKGYVEEPAPKVSFHTFGAFTLDLTIQFWVDSSQTSALDAKNNAIELVNTAFLSERIDMPIPTQTVLLQSNQ